MTTIADLHTHSTASDGQYPPAELVRLARNHGLQALSLTDHDTLDGLPAAEEAGKALGLRVIPGVELGAAEYQNLHILGYQFRRDDPALCRLCREMKEGREARKYRIADYLRDKGVPVPLEEVERVPGGGGSRPHFALAMIRLGYVSSVQEAFDRFLGTEEFMRAVRRPKPSARMCVETIRNAGGQASLAHPYQMGLDAEALEQLIRRLAGYGLGGIECHYPRHTEAQTAFYLRLAEKYGLHATGGSDFHGERVKPGIRLAGLRLDLDWLAKAGEGR